MAPTATPTPIPAFAPVLRPEARVPPVGMPDAVLLADFEAVWLVLVLLAVMGEGLRVNMVEVGVAIPLVKGIAWLLKGVAPLQTGSWLDEA